MKIMVIGQQAREHALLWRLSLSDQVSQLYVMPGNSYMDYWPKVQRVTPLDADSVVKFCHQVAMTYVLIGPFGPLESGLVDELQAHHIRVIGAPQSAALLEGSKWFSKAFMMRYGIPTPAYKKINDLASLTPAMIQSVSFPCMIKSDRVIRSHFSAMKIDYAETDASHQSMINACETVFKTQANYYGQGAVLLEDFQVGREVSFTIALDEKAWCPLATCQDYKKLGAGDIGPNTSGMGAMAPADWLSTTTYQKILRSIVMPTLEGMRAEKLLYRGFLYFGILVTPKGDPLLLEYNCRLGDPEAQSLCLLLDDDLASMLFQLGQGNLAQFKPRWRSGYALSVYLVPKGYPTDCQGGHPLKINPLRLDFSSTDRQFFTGAMAYRESDSSWISGDNRVFCLSAYAESIEEARAKIYPYFANIDRTFFHFREDIGLC